MRWFQRTIYTPYVRFVNLGRLSFKMIVFLFSSCDVDLHASLYVGQRVGLLPKFARESPLVSLVCICRQNEPQSSFFWISTQEARYRKMSSKPEHLFAQMRHGVIHYPCSSVTEEGFVRVWLSVHGHSSQPFVILDKRKNRNVHSETVIFPSYY